MKDKKAFAEITQHINKAMANVDTDSVYFDDLTTNWAKQLANAIAPHYVDVSEALFVGNWHLLDYHNDPEAAFYYASGLLEHAFETQS